MLSGFFNDFLLPILFTTGFLAGMVDAIAGGGGLITLPVLLSVGIPPHLAIGTSKFQATVGTAVATYTYARKGWLTRQGLMVGLVFSFIGSVLGAMTSLNMQSHTLKIIIPICLCLILVYTFFSPQFGMQDKKPRMKVAVFYMTFGTVLGFYDGFMGPGVGSLWVFLLMFFLGHNVAKATAYTKVFNLNTNVTALLCFAWGNNIDFRIGLCMAVGQVIGARVGASLAVKSGAKLIRPIFLIMVTVTLIVLIYRSF